MLASVYGLKETIITYPMNERHVIDWFGSIICLF